MRYYFLVFCCILLVACNPAQIPQPLPETTSTMNLNATIQSGVDNQMDDLATEFPDPYSPQSGDEKFSRAIVFLDSSQINIMESYPVQINLYLQGSLPTPCHQLRVDILQPDTEKRILIDIYSLFDPNKICAQVLQTFEANISLGSFPTGNYSIWINGTQIGDFDI